MRVWGAVAAGAAWLMLAGAASAAVAVTGESPIVDTARTNTSGALSSKELTSLSFSYKGRGAGLMDVLLTAPAGSDATVPVGKTDASGSISLDAVLGRVPVGKNVTVTQRTCGGGTSILIGDVPAKQDGCKDQPIGGFAWGSGPYEFDLHKAWRITPAKGAIGGAGLIVSTVFLKSLGGSSDEPQAQMPEGTPATTPSTGTWTPSDVMFKGRYGNGVFNLVTGNCNYFVPSFGGSLNVNTWGDGRLELEVMESITRRYVGRVQVTGATTGTGTATGSGALPGNIAYTSVANVAFGGDQATVEETLTLTPTGCSSTFRAMLMRER